MRSILVALKNWKSEMYISLPLTSTPLIYEKLQGPKRKLEKLEKNNKMLTT